MSLPFEIQNKQVVNAISRRHFFQSGGIGIGKIALASLLSGASLPAKLRAADKTDLINPLTAKTAQFKPRAKNVIYLFMAGAPSQLELLDYKPELEKYHDSAPPEKYVKELRLAFAQQNARLMAPQYAFKKHGKSGNEISEIMPYLSEVADEICILKSLHTDQFNHAPAQVFLNTGSPIPGRPSMGSWVTYGLGSEADDLPAFVVLTSGGGTSGGTANFSCGFLPSLHTGVPFRSQGSPIINVQNPAGVNQKIQRDTLNLIRALNERHLDVVGDPEISSRISAYEMAFRMQSRAPELMDFSQETKETLAMYGAEPGKSSFASHCLLARRLVERGVRFVNLYLKGWDHHSNVKGGLKNMCGKCDQASAALIKDLKQRGLLDDTLVIWGGEFGRTPIVEANATLGRVAGRDHHPSAFSMWMAGGGVKSGFTWGASDELGFNAVENPIHIHDLQATILHLLGLDHERLTYTYQGRPYRLTDIYGKPVSEILA